MTPATALHEAEAGLPKVLVVDDDQATRALLAKALFLSGCRVTCAEELDEAAAILDYRDYDVLCLDLDLRGLSCFEGLELIGQARNRRPEINIVVQTVNGDPMFHRACYRHGATSIFIKGRPMAEFLRLLNCPQREAVSC